MFDLFTETLGVGLNSSNTILVSGAVKTAQFFSVRSVHGALTIPEMGWGSSRNRNRPADSFRRERAEPRAVGGWRWFLGVVIESLLLDRSGQLADLRTGKHEWALCGRSGRSLRGTKGRADERLLSGTKLSLGQRSLSGLRHISRQWIRGAPNRFRIETSRSR